MILQVQDGMATLALGAADVVSSINDVGDIFTALGEYSEELKVSPYRILFHRKAAMTCCADLRSGPCERCRLFVHLMHIKRHASRILYLRNCGVYLTG